MLVFLSLSPPSPAMNGFIAGIISGVILTLVGNTLIYLFQRLTKLRDIADNSRSSLQYIFMALCLQRSKLANIPKILEARNQTDKNKLNMQKVVFLPLTATINEELLQKVLAYTKFNKSKMSSSTVQSIINAEQAFRKCVSFIKAFNESVDEDRFLKADNQSRAVYLQIINNHVQGIEFSYNEAVVINKKARRRTALIGKKLFGKKFVPSKIDPQVIEAKDI